MWVNSSNMCVSFMYILHSPCRISCVDTTLNYKYMEPVWSIS